MQPSLLVPALQLWPHTTALITESEVTHVLQVMNRTVVVVGAGFAGLAAAKKELVLGGARVIVLEGGDRVGGRACTNDLNGLCRTEFGATYLHGIQGHHVYNLAAASGLLGPVHTKGGLSFASSQSNLLHPPPLLPNHHYHRAQPDLTLSLRR